MTDYDIIVVGSGFGGSVTALRLTEKGYRVGVLEAGRRYTPETLPKTSWDLRAFLWARWDDPARATRVAAGAGQALAYGFIAGGMLQVGPQSAGAEPGPICYGRGGREPTVTDANLLLGRINPARINGGVTAPANRTTPAEASLATSVR